ncbi:MAG: hypothetical protein ABIY70_14205 [Capsulimonas sp.]
MTNQSLYSSSQFIAERLAQEFAQTAVKRDKSGGTPKATLFPQEFEGD